ncbi:acyl carrier protein [Rhizobium sp. FKL33]|uniref:acyl carrier protein n=1 Tax=Rhizobium sp. FKL33 TaxID=2562307 RepID=UPI0010BF6807|nr:acyl carrier protein [Rhizobium sp. FKL33]
MTETIREILKKHANLPAGVDDIADGADLYAAGLSSFASVQVMLALEENFDIEFPDNLLNRKSFQSIEAIARTVDSILDGRKVA